MQKQLITRPKTDDLVNVNSKVKESLTNQRAKNIKSEQYREDIPLKSIEGIRKRLVFTEKILTGSNSMDTISGEEDEVDLGDGSSNKQAESTRTDTTETLVLDSLMKDGNDQEDKRNEKIQKFLDKEDEFLVCNICQRIFKYQPNLSKHMILVHKEICLAQANNIGKRESETKTKQTNQRNLDSILSTPKNHGKNYYECDICNLFFTVRVNFLSHRLYVHNLSESDCFNTR